MDGAMGKEEDVVEAVLTCEGDFHDPQLYTHIEIFRNKLKDLLHTDTRKVQVRKVEPWNSVKVTLTIPREAAVRLRQLAQNGSEALKEIGVLSVQMQGDSQIALTFLGSNNEHKEVILNSSSTSNNPSSNAIGDTANQHVSNPQPAEAVVSLDDLNSSPGPSSDEVTRKNIVDYLRQGPHLRQNAALIGSLMGAVGAISSTSSPMLGTGQDSSAVSNPVSSFIGSKPQMLRSNSIATVVSAALLYQEPNVSTSVPCKTTGAFHSPLPRHTTSVAINSSLSGSSSLQVQHQSSDKNFPTIQSTALRQLSSIAGSGTGYHSFASNTNNCSPLGPLTQPSTLSNSSFSTSKLGTASSASPNYYVDLPPPPPYPHSLNIAASPRLSKPGNASSPMLVNLLQIDPSVATAGLASGNANKPLAVKEPSVSDCPPKKKRKRKEKTNTAKPLQNDLASSQHDIQTFSTVSDPIDSHSVSEQTTKMTDAYKPIDVFSKRIGTSPLGFLNESKTSQYYPGKVNHKDGLASSGIQSNFIKSAIGSRTNNSMLLGSSAQLSQQQAEAFLSETTAGKIINPYTGQLEPRDSVLDSGQSLPKDPGLSQGSGYSATRMLAQRAQELDEIAQKSVPHSSSTKLDIVHATQHVCSPSVGHTSASTITTTITAAASAVSSSELLQRPVSKVPWRNFTSVTSSSVKVSLTQSKIIASSSHSCQSGTVVSSSVNLPLHPSSEPRHALPQNLAKKNINPDLSNGPLVCDTEKGSKTRIVHSEMDTPVQAPEAVASSTESVIYPNVNVCMHSVTSQPKFYQAPFVENLSDMRKQLKAGPLAASPSWLSMSVSLDIPSAHTSQSSPVTEAEQTKLPFQGHAMSTHHRQAATFNSDKVPFSTSVTSPSLLNSVLDKHMDSHSSTESPPEIKVLSEGDENSNQSGVVTDPVTEHSGTATLIEHTRVKIENHDSGVGSSSERSDDTPSELGDAEFRASHPSTESDESNIKNSLPHKGVDCKQDQPFVPANNSMSENYRMSPCNESSHIKSSGPQKGTSLAKKRITIPASSEQITGSDICQFYDAHCKSMEKQAGLMAVEQVSLTSNWLSEKAGSSQHSSHGSKTKENGPLISDSLENRAGLKTNGPIPQGNMNTVMMAMTELHPKKISSKQVAVNNIGTPVHLKEEHKGKELFLEKLNQIHHHQEDQKESSASTLASQEMKTVEGTIEEPQQNTSPPQRLEGHAEQLFLDLEEMQAKIIGNGSAAMTGVVGTSESKGNNITSIYSKRSSPVNVNMLNHIYAPGLPLPRRLTESVQRLVKPLPASEIGMSLPVSSSRAYNSKPIVSSAIGIVPRAGTATLSSTNGSHHSARMGNHSGARSPGASVPRLIPSDQHHLLSGGLDLAGLSSTYSTDSVSLGGGMSSLNSVIPIISSDGMREDFVLKGDTHPLSVKFGHPPPSILRDTQSYSSKMLSQSYPPFKTKGHLANIGQQNQDVQINLDASKNNSIVLHHFANSKRESSSVFHEKINTQVAEQGNSLHNNHSLVVGKLSAEETNHSNIFTDGLQSHRFSSSSDSTSTSTIVHSNASSPLMPILQRDQEPPFTPTLPSTVPNISSQLSLVSITTTMEISPTLIDDAAIKSTTVLATTAQLHPVPCSSSFQSTSSSLSSKASFENAVGSTEASCTESYAIRLPILSPIVSSPSSPMVTQPNATPSTIGSSKSLSEHSNDRCEPPKLTKAHPVTITPVLPKCSSQGYQFNRNIFDTVSVVSFPKQENELALSTKSNSNFSNVDFVTSPKCNDDDTGILPSLPKEAIDSEVELEEGSMANSFDPHKKDFYENGSKQNNLLSKDCSQESSSKTLKPKLYPSELLSQPLEISKIIRNSETLPDKAKAVHFATKKTTIVSKPSIYESVSATTAPCGTVNFTAHEFSSPRSFMPSSVPIAEESTSKPQQTTLLAGAPDSTSSNLASSSFNFPSSQANISNRSSPSNDIDGGSVSARVEEGPEHTNLSPTIDSPQVKEPILETLASALKQQREPSIQSRSSPLCKTLEKSSAHQRPPMVPLTASDISKLEQSMMLQGRMVAVQSSAQTKIHASEKEINESPLEPGDNVVNHSRITRKRKVNPSEEETHDIEETAFSRADPQKLVGPGSSFKSKAHDTALMKMENVKDTSPLESGKVHFKAGMVGSEGKNESSKTNMELGDTPAKVTPDLEKSQERRRHRSNTSSQSDDVYSHRSVSNDSKDSSIPGKEGRANKTAVQFAPERDGRTHRNNYSSTGEGKSHQRTYPGSEKDAQSKENRSIRVPGHYSGEDSRHAHVDWSQDHSVDDKDKTRSLGSKMLPANDKFSSPEGKDDGQKKVQRVRRQFYAYVPEKSLDQTYFDTPILSGRTRSKNKPSDEEAAAGTASTSTMPSSVVPTASTDPITSSSHNTVSSATTGTGHVAGHGKHASDHGGLTNSEAAGSGVKRSTRAVRTKDVSQEQNPNKRRKVQQQR
ncbi:nuclear receptor coactivator 6 [Plakobranchus ocellatus]|uniref:Nuclear receptor coactivator 6 n=1 Tax=Plakobranchus ocellatus TaxID=259542 RepID=A0AAV4BI92_9GAST|nr:nuclear receptor coactivator 6 [Plakobranchus ocellatus]